MDEIIERIEREAGVPGLVDLLAERLSASDLQSLMLEVYRRRSKRVQPAALLADFAANRFARPAAVSPLALLAWEQTAYAHLPEGFEALALAPVCPLGTNSVVAQVDPNWSWPLPATAKWSRTRPTCWRWSARCGAKPCCGSIQNRVKRCTWRASQRLLRAQRYRGAGALAHFSAFALCSAGRDRGGWQFELDCLRLHARFYLRALRAYLGAGVGLAYSLTLLGEDVGKEQVEKELFAPVREEFEGVSCVFDAERTSGRGYYRGLCFHIHALHPDGRRLELVDGGWVDWTQKLLGSAKERLVISGIGSERLVAEFGGR